MLREANEKLGELVSNAVDKLVSDAEDPLRRLSAYGQAGGVTHEGAGASSVRIQPHCAGGGAAAQLRFLNQVSAAVRLQLGAGFTQRDEGRLPAELGEGETGSWSMIGAALEKPSAEGSIAAAIRSRATDPAVGKTLREFRPEPTARQVGTELSYGDGR